MFILRCVLGISVAGIAGNKLEICRSLSSDLVLGISKDSLIVLLEFGKRPLVVSRNSIHTLVPKRHYFTVEAVTKMKHISCRLWVLPLSPSRSRSILLSPLLRPLLHSTFPFLPLPQKLPPHPPYGPPSPQSCHPPRHSPPDPHPPRAIPFAFRPHNNP